MPNTNREKAVSNHIVMLEIVFQWPATWSEIEADQKRPKDQKALVGKEVPMVSAREFIKCDIPIGEGFDGRDTLKRLILRAVVYHMERRYKTFYCIAHFESTDGKNEFMRTVMPRTEISPRLRALK
jgi:hypothetical protein